MYACADQNVLDDKNFSFNFNENENQLFACYPNVL